MINHLRNNLQVMATSMAHLARTPGASLMTVAAIGVTLSLPALLYVLTENIDQLSGSWESQAQVNLFLSRDVDNIEAIEQQLRTFSTVAHIQSIPPEQGLREFKEYAGLAQASDLLEENPLPWTLVVHLSPEDSDLPAVEAFIERSASLPGVARVRSDVLWLKRLAAMVHIGHRLVWILAVLLGVAVVVIISNTVRLAILSRAHEIEVIKLIGGTDRFIRRPFLYQGFLQGVLGAVAAVLMVTGCIEALRGPVADLVGEYGGGYPLLGLSWAAAGWLLLLGSGLGWCAAMGSVGRHLKEIEPR